MLLAPGALGGQEVAGAPLSSREQEPRAGALPSVERSTGKVRTYEIEFLLSRKAMPNVVPARVREAAAALGEGMQQEGAMGRDQLALFAGSFPDQLIGELPTRCLGMPQQLTHTGPVAGVQVPEDVVGGVGAAAGQSVAGVGAALSSREQQRNAGAYPTVKAYREEVLAYLQQVGSPVPLSSVGHYVSRPVALKTGPGKMAMRDIFRGDPRFQIDGLAPSQTLSPAGPAGIVFLLFAFACTCAGCLFAGV